MPKNKDLHKEIEEALHKKPTPEKATHGPLDEHHHKVWATKKGKPTHSEEVPNPPKNSLHHRMRLQQGRKS